MGVVAGGQPGKGGTVMKSTVSTFRICLLLGAGPSAGTDCDGWNTKEFFKPAKGIVAERPFGRVVSVC